MKVLNDPQVKAELSKHDLVPDPGTPQDLARYILGHRVWLGPHAASHGVSVEMVIDDIVDRVPVP